MSTGWWVFIEAEFPEDNEHVKCGPFDTEAEAVEHMEDSTQVQGFCEDDAVDCWVTDTPDTTTDVWDKFKEDWGTYAPIKDKETS